jgi:hypothetical protein
MTVRACVVIAAHVDVTVIRVAHEPVAATLKFAIQLIQNEIREQRRERTSLRGSLPAVLKQPVVSFSFAGSGEPTLRHNHLSCMWVGTERYSVG